MWLIFALLVSLAAFFIILPLFKKEIENESLSLNMEQLENNSVFKDQKIKLSKRDCKKQKLEKMGFGVGLTHFVTLSELALSCYSPL